MGNEIFIEKMLPEDWGQVSQIYREGIETGYATFEKEIPAWRDWDNSHSSECRIVARSKEEILGWAALSPASKRRVYAGVAEVSVYVRKCQYGKRNRRFTLKCPHSQKRGKWILDAASWDIP